MAEWITVSAASRQLGIAERTVRHRIRQGKLSAKKEGGRWLIDEDSIGKLGKSLADDSARSARSATIAVPLERYEALITRLAQLEAENDQYKRLLEHHQEPWWRRWFRKDKA